MPKCTGSELKCPSDEPFIPGYGLYFIRSLSWIKIWTIIAIFTLLAFTCSGLWIGLHGEDSIQDVFAITGCALTVVTIVLGLAHGLDSYYMDRYR